MEHRIKKVRAKIISTYKVVGVLTISYGASMVAEIA